jgi:hypothetical protein
MTSEPKRHHYVPRFLLKRFAEHSDTKRPCVWWLSKATGANARRSVENEAVIGHYYRISDAADVPAGFPEKVLSDVEGPAAEAIRELDAQPRSLSLEHRQALALFVVLQHKRTPAGREHLRFIDELTHRLLTEVNLNNPESWADAMKATGDFETDEQAERERLGTLRDFQEGRVIVESTPDREIAGMFLAAPEVSSFLTTDAFSWSLLQPRGQQRFVLGDSPVALYETGSPEKPGGMSCLFARTSETRSARRESAGSQGGLNFSTVTGIARRPAALVSVEARKERETLSDATLPPRQVDRLG